MDAPRRDGDPLTTAELTVGGGGCACRTGHRSPGSHGLSMLVLGLLVLARGIRQR
jgi:MYXO-CTERM domain-containing protein